MFFKRLLCLVFCIMLGSSVFAFAETEGAINVFYTEKIKGENLEIPVKISGCKGIISLITEITYDKNVMELSGVKNGDFFKSSPTKSQNITDNPYKIYWESTSSGNRTGNGTLCTLVFKVKSTENNKITLKVTDCFNADFKNVNLPVYSITKSYAPPVSSNNGSSDSSNDGDLPTSSAEQEKQSDKKAEFTVNGNTVTVKPSTQKPTKVTVVTQNGEQEIEKFSEKENGEITFQYETPEEIIEVKTESEQSSALSVLYIVIPFVLVLAIAVIFITIKIRKK